MDGERITVMMACFTGVAFGFYVIYLTEKGNRERDEGEG